MPFLNSITPNDERILTLLNQFPVLYNNQKFTLTEILEGNVERSLDFLKTQVCSNTILTAEQIPVQVSHLLRDHIPTQPIIQISNYSNWMKKATKSINLDELLIKEHQIEHIVSGLIEMVIVKKTIQSAIDINNTALDEHEEKKQSKRIFIDLIAKLHPAILAKETWEIITCVLMQSFSNDIPYLIETLTELSEKTNAIPIFSNYLTVAKCVQNNQLFNNILSKESDLISLFSNSIHSKISPDLKSIFILLALQNPDRSSLIMQALDHIIAQIPDNNRKIDEYLYWKSIIQKVFLSFTEKESGFLYKTIISLLQDQHLNPKWFPILINYLFYDIIFFRAFMLSNNSEFYQYIKIENPKLLENHCFPIIKEMDRQFNYSYREYKTDIEWLLLDERVKNSLLHIIFQEDDAKQYLPTKVINNLLKIFFARKATNLSLFKILIERCDLDQYETITSKIELFLKAPTCIQKIFLESWILLSETHPNQNEIIYQMTVKLKKFRVNNAPLEAEKILQKHIDKLTSKAVEIQEELLKSPTLKPHKKSKKRPKKKKSAVKSTLLASNITTPTETNAMVNVAKNDVPIKAIVTQKTTSADPKNKENHTIQCRQEKPPQKALVQTQKKPLEDKTESEKIPPVPTQPCPLNSTLNSIHFTYNKAPLPPISDSNPDLFPSISIDHSILFTLKSLSNLHDHIYKNKINPPVLTCYGSTARLLFEQSFCHKETINIFNDIDLHIHLPEDICDNSISKWKDHLIAVGATGLYYIDGRIRGGDYFQLQFCFQNTQVDLSFSKKKLKQIFDLPTIRLTPHKENVGHFCIPDFFYDSRHNIKKTINFSANFNYEDLFNPKILSFIWKQVAYLRAAEYTYDRSFIHEMINLQPALLNQPHIIHEATALFFSKYFPKDPAFFSKQFNLEPIKISTLNPYMLTATLRQFITDNAAIQPGHYRRFS